MSSRSFLSRFLARKSGEAEPGPASAMSSWADNCGEPVERLVARCLRSPACLVVTGYQDFLSAMTLITRSVPDLHARPPGSIRIVFGSNSEATRRIGGDTRPVSEEARAHYLGARGLSLADMSELNAVLTMDAIERGIIALRIFDRERARAAIGRAPPMLHAKLFVGEDFVLSGSANFSRGGLAQNLEFVDDATAHPALSTPRREAAERFWELGSDWTEEALAILRGLIRMVSPEEAVARTVHEMTAHRLWRVEENRITGRVPQPYQADLVYEAAGTIYEHGFAFIEAPTGAGKTDIGKHLATVLPELHRGAVGQGETRIGDMRQGALALIPASVLGNWKASKPPHLELVKHSHLSKKREAEAELEEVNSVVRAASALIVDESHRLSSRYLAPSTRATVFEQSPAIWTACLSATLMGNQGLDGLLAFHEKRASIYVPPQITGKINAAMGKVTERAGLLDEISRISDGMARSHVQQDLFQTPDWLAAEKAKREAEMAERKLTSHDIQADLSAALAPYVVRRQRDCIGESADRTRLAYPPVENHRRDTELSQEQAEIIQRIRRLAEAIVTGTTLVSAEPKRAQISEIRFHDKSRIHIRNFLALLRASPGFAREEWQRERDPESDQRGRAGIGESLRRAERQNSGRLPVPEGALAGETAPPDSTTPICDRIGALLDRPDLDRVDEARADEMARIVADHGQAIFLAERIGVLERYARLLRNRSGKDTDIFLLAVGAAHGTPPGIHRLRRGEEAQDFFGRDGGKADRGRKRALFMTFQMAEGINLQMASALGILGVTSDIKSLIQGLGRIDRIDSPHARVHYYTFDLPGLVLSSDLKARDRIEGIAMLSGVGAEELPTELKEFAAGDLTDLVLEQARSKRPLRRDNMYDRLEELARALPHGLLDEIRRASPKTLWGSELCLLATDMPLTVLVLGSRLPSTTDARSEPPRLLAVLEREGQREIIGDQVVIAQLLWRAWRETVRRGRHQHRPTMDEFSAALTDLGDILDSLRPWDIRPARVFSLLSTLAEFLTGGEIADEGHALFGMLPLPALERLAEAWAAELDPFWIEAKRKLAERSRAGKSIPDYLGLADVVTGFLKQPKALVELTRARLDAMYRHALEESAEADPGILDRVAVVFHAQG
ncbi:phospholipase D family protein [Poseidonocella sp. HB161398]|uniref:phospholipase D family protein n=1 Tax=Poseidonocella sp. HB161398 TaxID=2320855 RepID=UPI0011090655|nr:phospholipase D family protein [Poseidonocella sp. HB161398]